MKYEEAYTEFDSRLLELIKSAIPASFATSLRENGTKLEFPQDLGLELKLKYDVREDGGAFSLKISWDNETEETEEEEEDSD